MAFADRGVPRPEAAVHTFITASDQMKGLLDEAECALTEGLAWVAESVDPVNFRLIEAGRDDLVIDQPATMASVDRPQDITEAFTRGFAIYTGVKIPDPEDESGSLRYEPIAATYDQVLDLRRLPRFYDFEEQAAMQESSLFPAVHKSLSWGWDTHASRPAFLRTLVLFPGFMARMAEAVSAPEQVGRLRQFDLPSFAAYNVMSKLVDQSDLSVMHGQRVNERYLLGPAKLKA
jgi:hypothetical protein